MATGMLFEMALEGDHDEETIELPVDAEILSVEVRAGTAWIGYISDSGTRPTISRVFRRFFPGKLVPEMENWEFVGRYAYGGMRISYFLFVKKLPDEK